MFLSHKVTSPLQNRKMERVPESRVLNERQGVVFKGNLACQVGQPTWRRGDFECVAKPGGVPDVLVYTWEMSTFFTLGGDLEVLCPKIYKAKERLHLSRALRKRGFFWEIRRCCSSQGTLFWQREEREHNQKHRCTPQTVRFLLLLFNLGFFLQDQKIPIRMTLEGKVTSLCSLSWFFPSLSAEKHLV